MPTLRPILAAGILVLFSSCGDSPPVEEADQAPESTNEVSTEGTLEFTESLQQVVKHLGKGGVHYSLTNVEGDAEGFATIIDQIVAPMASGPDAVLPPSFSFGELLRDLHVHHVKAIGQSAHKEGSYWHNRAFFLTEGRRGGVLSLFGGKGKPFQAPTFVPADADLVIELELNLKQARDVAKKIASSFGPDTEKDLGEALGERLLEGSLTLGDFLGKFKVRLVVAAVIDPTQQIEISENFTVPGVKLVGRIDGAKWMWEAYSKFLAEESVTKSVDGLEMIINPEPLETPMGEIQPVLALEEETGSIWFSLREDYLQAVRSGETTLASSADYQKAVAGLPVNGNALVYNSSRLVAEFNKVYRAAQDELGNGTGEVGASVQMLKAFILPFADTEPQPFAGVISNNDEGVLIAMNGPTPIKGRSLVGSTATVAALASLATPQVYKALERAQMAENMNRARMAKIALDQYALSSDGNYPDSLDDLAKNENVETDADFLTMVCSDKEKRPWGYVKGLDTDSPDFFILLYGVEAVDGKRIVVQIDGSTKMIPDVNLEALLSAQQ